MKEALSTPTPQKILSYATEHVSKLSIFLDALKILEMSVICHHTCIEYGSKIYERKCTELERLREQSLVELEERIWGLANEDKEQAIKETYEQGQEELKKFEEYAKKEKVGQL